MQLAMVERTRAPAGRDGGLADMRPLLDLAPDWAAFLRAGLNEEDHQAIRAGERTGRPPGSARLAAGLERRLKRTLVLQKPGPKSKLQSQR